MFCFDNQLIARGNCTTIELIAESTDLLNAKANPVAFDGLYESADGVDLHGTHRNIAADFGARA